MSLINSWLFHKKILTLLAGGENPARWACFPALQTEKRPQISPLSPPHSRAETMQIFKGQSLESF